MLLNNLSGKVDKLLSHFRGQLPHASNFEILDVDELRRELLKDLILKGTIHLTEVAKVELFVSIGSSFLLKDGHKALACDLACGSKRKNFNFFEVVVAVLLDDAIAKHG